MEQPDSRFPKNKDRSWSLSALDVIPIFSQMCLYKTEQPITIHLSNYFKLTTSGCELVMSRAFFKWVCKRSLKPIVSEGSDSLKQAFAKSL